MMYNFGHHLLLWLRLQLLTMVFIPNELLILVLLIKSLIFPLLNCIILAVPFYSSLTCCHSSTQSIDIPIVNTSPSPISACPAGSLGL
jgi:hypothetical protein